MEGGPVKYLGKDLFRDLYLLLTGIAIIG